MRWTGTAGTSLDSAKYGERTSAKQQLKRDTSCTTVVKRTNIKNVVGFLVHMSITKSVMGCRPISSRLIFIRLRADPFNITVMQVYARTTDYSDDQVEDFYSQLQRIIDQAPKNDILSVIGMQKLAKLHKRTGKTMTK